MKFNYSMVLYLDLLTKLKDLLSSIYGYDFYLSCKLKHLADYDIIFIFGFFFEMIYYESYEYI